MFKLLEIENLAVYEGHVFTRYLHLENLDTGTIECCFDCAIDDYDFMVEGNDYDCKIILLGSQVKRRWFEKEVKKVDILEFTIIGEEKVGKYNRVKVMRNDDIYYIDPSEIDEYSEKIFFKFFRKDIIQVNGIVC